MTFACKSAKLFENYLVNCRFTLSFICPLGLGCYTGWCKPLMIDGTAAVGGMSAPDEPALDRSEPEDQDGERWSSRRMFDIYGRGWETRRNRDRKLRPYTRRRFLL